MSTCPNCGGTKVEFRRERTGSTSSSNGASVKLTKISVPEVEKENRRIIIEL